MLFIEYQVREWAKSLFIFLSPSAQTTLHLPSLKPTLHDKKKPDWKKKIFLYYLLCWTARSQTCPLRFWFFMQVFLLKCREYDCVFILLWWPILTDFLQPSKVTFWSIISNVMNQWRDKKYLLNATVKVFVADQQ